MAKRDFRKVIHYSKDLRALVIPKEFVKELKIEVGTNIQMDLTNDGKLILKNADADMTDMTAEKEPKR